MSAEARNVVAGKAHGGERFDVINPADFNTTVGTCYAADPDLVDEAARSAAAVADEWRQTPLRDRIDLVRQGIDRALGGQRREELASLLTQEQGKVLAESRTELSHASALTDLFAALVEKALADDVLKDERGTRLRKYVPIGPVAAITPWNWPIVLAMVKVVSALLTGNPVLLKPPPNTPLTITEIAGAIAEVLPPGVLSILHGGAEVGAALTQHPAVRKVAFTGSTPNGRKVFAAAASTVKSLTLELGGNDAAVLLDDVELRPELVQRMLGASFVTSGQVCWAIKRVYVPRTRYAEVVDAFCAAVDNFVLGDGLDPQVTMGPLNNRQQLDIVTSLVDDARKAGATVRELGRYAPGAHSDRGFFHRPTVVSDIANDAALVQREQFGPALPIVAYDDESDAIRWANDTEFGLCASVWSSDTARAFEVADRLDAGQIFVNAHGGPALDFTCGTGGIKQSGLGRELGVEGLREYLEPKLITNRPFG